jgi:hypothetical protein
MRADFHITTMNSIIIKPERLLNSSTSADEQSLSSPPSTLAPDGSDAATCHENSAIDHHQFTADARIARREAEGLACHRHGSHSPHKTSRHGRRAKRSTRGRRPRLSQTRFSFASQNKSPQQTREALYARPKALLVTDTVLIRLTKQVATADARSALREAEGLACHRHNSHSPHKTSRHSRRAKRTTRGRKPRLSQTRFSFASQNKSPQQTREAHYARPKASLVTDTVLNRLTKEIAEALDLMSHRHGSHSPHKKDPSFGSYEHRRKKDLTAPSPRGLLVYFDPLPSA